MLELGNKLLKTHLGVTKEHPRVVLEEEGILNTRKPSGHGPLADNDRSGAVHFDNGHPIDGTSLIIPSTRVDDIIGPQSPWPRPRFP